MRKPIAGFFTVLLIVFCFLGCAQTTQYVRLPNSANEVDDPAKGRIYLIRPSIFGGAVGMKVTDEGKEIGKTFGKSYISWEREPGNHIIEAQAENKEQLSLFVKQGGRVYVKQGIEMGVFMARNSLTPIDEQTAKEYMAKMKPPKVKLTEG